MDILETAFVKGYIRMANDGWHERNGGNLTYRIKPEEAEEVKQFFDYGKPFQLIGTSVPGLESLSVPRDFKGCIIAGQITGRQEKRLMLKLAVTAKILFYSIRAGRPGCFFEYMLRKLCSMTRNKLAEAAGISGLYIKKMESGTRWLGT